MKFSTKIPGLFVIIGVTERGNLAPTVVNDSAEIIERSSLTYGNKENAIDAAIVMVIRAANRMHLDIPKDVASVEEMR